MISINNLIVGYGSKQVLNGVIWNINEGLIHGLVGLNGSGKTTFLKAMFGLLKPVSGEMKMDGESLNKKFISLLETEPYFYHGISGREYLSLFKTSGNYYFNTDEWAALFHLPLSELIDNYSTGMKKKLSLLGIIKTNKSLLLLDEPFNGLDLESSRVLATVLRRMKQNGKTIIITSHMLETLTDLCDQLHYLKNGVIEKTYQPEDISVMSKEIFDELDQHINQKIERLLNS